MPPSSLLLLSSSGSYPMLCGFLIGDSIDDFTCAVILKIHPRFKIYFSPHSSSAILSALCNMCCPFGRRVSARWPEVVTANSSPFPTSRRPCFLVLRCRSPSDCRLLVAGSRLWKNKSRDKATRGWRVAGNERWELIRWVWVVDSIVLVNTALRCSHALSCSSTRWHSCSDSDPSMTDSNRSIRLKDSRSVLDSGDRGSSAGAETERARSAGGERCMIDRSVMCHSCVQIEATDRHAAPRLAWAPRFWGTTERRRRLALVVRAANSSRNHRTRRGTDWAGAPYQAVAGWQMNSSRRSSNSNAFQWVEWDCKREEKVKSYQWWEKYQFLVDAWRERIKNGRVKAGRPSVTRAEKKILGTRKRYVECRQSYAEMFPGEWLQPKVGFYTQTSLWISFKGRPENFWETSQLCRYYVGIIMLLQIFLDVKL